MKAKRERCDHCKKIVNAHHNLYTLEEIASEELEWQFAICAPCFDKRNLSDRL